MSFVKYASMKSSEMYVICTLYWFFGVGLSPGCWSILLLEPVLQRHLLGPMATKQNVANTGLIVTFSIGVPDFKPVKHELERFSRDFFFWAFEF